MVLVAVDAVVIVLTVSVQSKIHDLIRSLRPADAHST